MRTVGPRPGRWGGPADAERTGRGGEDGRASEPAGHTRRGPRPGLSSGRGPRGPPVTGQPGSGCSPPPGGRRRLAGGDPCPGTASPLLPGHRRPMPPRNAWPLSPSAAREAGQDASSLSGFPNEQATNRRDGAGAGRAASKPLRSRVRAGPRPSVPSPPTRRAPSWSLLSQPSVSCSRGVRTAASSPARSTTSDEPRRPRGGGLAGGVRC